MLRFNANLFRLAFGFTSTEEIRFYLQGVFVEPHPQGGVTLTATDGHRLVCIRDENGSADESAVIKLGDALKQCKHGRGATRSVVIKTDESQALIYEEREGASGSFNIATAYDVRIVCTFPDYRRVVPQKFSDNGAPGFQGSYLSSFGDLARELAAHIGYKPTRGGGDGERKDGLRVLCGLEKDSKPESMPALVQFTSLDFAFGILMPIRIADTKPVLPSWFRASAPKAEAAE